MAWSGAGKKGNLTPTKSKLQLSSLVSKAVEETFTAKLADVIKAIRASEVPAQQSLLVISVVPSTPPSVASGSGRRRHPASPAHQPTIDSSDEDSEALSEPKPKKASNPSHLPII